jgi:hypothetical protein
LDAIHPSLSSKVALERAFLRGNGKVIEDYSDDQPYPSCLKLVVFMSRPIHVVLAMDTEDNEVIVITAYEPGLDKWEAGFEIRRKN